MKYIKLTLCLFLCIKAGAQQELPARAILPPEDTAAVSALLDYAMQIAGQKRDSALYYVSVAYDAARRLEFHRGQAYAAHLLGTNEMKLGRYEKANSYYFEALNFSRAINDTSGILLSMTVLGVNEGLQNNSSQALGWFLRVLKVYQRKNDEAGLAEIYYKIGLIHGQVKDFDRAIQYQNLSLRYAENNGNKRMAMGVLTNIGMLYGKQNKSKPAFEALYRAKTLSEELEHLPNLAEVYLNLGNVHRYDRRLDSSEYYLQKALHLYKKTKFPLGLTGVYSALAALKYHKGETDSALYFATLGLEGANAIEDHDLLFENLQTLQKTYYKDGQYEKAAGMLDTILAARNMVGASKNDAAVERTKIALDLEDRELKINALESRNKLTTIQRNGLLLLTFLGITFTIYVVYSLRQIRKKNRYLRDQKASLEELNLVKDKLFSVISHDLRGPFTRILAILDLVESDVLTEEEKKEVNTQLRLSTTATLATLDNLLMWGSSQMKQEAPRPERVNLKQVTESTLELYGIMAQDKSIRLNNKITEDLYVWFNKNQLEFVVRNLVANAIKFSPEHKEVTLEAFGQNDRIIFSVEDQGVGMSEEKRRSLFNPHEKTISKGTAGESGVGLGLTLIMEFLEKNNGSIKVTSEEGRGSVFTVLLPAAP